MSVAASHAHLITHLTELSKLAVRGEKPTEEHVEQSRATIKGLAVSNSQDHTLFTLALESALSGHCSLVSIQEETTEYGKVTKALLLALIECLKLKCITTSNTALMSTRVLHTILVSRSLTPYQTSLVRFCGEIVLMSCLATVSSTVASTFTTQRRQPEPVTEVTDAVLGFLKPIRQIIRDEFPAPVASPERAPVIRRARLVDSSSTVTCAPSVRSLPSDSRDISHHQLLLIEALRASSSTPADAIATIRTAKTYILKLNEHTELTLAQAYVETRIFAQYERLIKFLDAAPYGKLRSLSFMKPLENNKDSGVLVQYKENMVCIPLIGLLVWTFEKMKQKRIKLFSTVYPDMTSAQIREDMENHRGFNLGLASVALDTFSDLAERFIHALGKTPECHVKSCASMRILDIACYYAGEFVSSVSKHVPKIGSLALALTKSQDSDRVECMFVEDTVPRSACILVSNNIKDVVAAAASQG